MFLRKVVHTLLYVVYLDKTTGTKSPTMDLISLPDFFSNKTFFLYGEFDSEERRKLIRYITAYDG